MSKSINRRSTQKSIQKDEDNAMTLMFLQSPLFASIIQKAVKSQTDLLSTKVHNLEHDIKALTDFNLEVIRTICEQNSAPNLTFNLEKTAYLSTKAENGSFTERKLSIDKKERGSRSRSDVENIKPKIISVSELAKFISECCQKVGIEEDKAKVFTNCLVSAEVRGLSRQGLASLDSNNFGYNSFYTEHAASKGFIGISLTNTRPMMVPSGGKELGFGCNPFALSAPAENNDRVVLDIASTAVEMEKIIEYKKKNMKIPLGWALDENGQPTTDPEVAIKANKLAPVGGSESHKGTGLALIVEILSSLLADSAFGPNVRGSHRKSTNMGHGFIVVDPKKFAPGFEKRLYELNNIIRKLTPIDPKRPVQIPGDIERENIKKVEKQGGIVLNEDHFQAIFKLVALLNVKAPKFK